MCCLPALLVCFAVADSVLADVQTWVDGGADNVWSTNSANWTGGAVWTNGNSAVFAGAGGTIDVSAVVAVSNLTFGAGGYTIADPDANGTLTFMGGPTIVSVPTAGTTGVIYKTIGGAGFTKTGAGVLRLAAANTFTGVVRVAAGVLRLTNNTATVLGATGTGHETIVEDGATLDANSAWSANVNEDIVIKGAGVDGNGAFVNNGAFTYYNVGYHNLTLAGDATIGGSTRFDMSSSGITYGNGFTLTKMGACEVAVGRPVTNCPIVINAGTYTVQSATALGEPDYATTLNGGKLMAW
jgi:autotransporter-associated beta strand protein